MGKRELHRIVDNEGVVHFQAPVQVVNAALCGCDGLMNDADGPVDCRACIATVRHVLDHRRPSEVGHG